MTSNRTSVLFVCMGNICRSPLAEAMFRHLATERGVDHLFEIDSAGTSSYHVGDPPDPRSVATAHARGVAVVGRSRQVAIGDFERFDYVVAMDSENLRSLERLASANRAKSRLHLLREWDTEEPGGDVPDPYYGGPRGFDDVHDIVERSCERLLAALIEEIGGPAL